MAVLTVVNAGGNWGTAATFSPAQVPTTSDDIVFTASSGQLTVNSGATRVCKSIDFTNYTNTFSLNVGLTVSGNIKFVSGMSVAASAATNVLSSGASVSTTWTSAGLSMPFTIAGGSSSTNTLADDWTVSGFGTGPNSTWSGQTVYCSGSLTGPNAGTITGSTDIVLNGTGTWAQGSGQGLALNLTINTAGTITVSGTVGFGASGKTLTYTAGTVTTTSSTLNLLGTAITLNTSGITWNNLACPTASPTVTLNSNLNSSGNFTTSNGNGTITFAGTGNATFGSLVMNATNSAATMNLKFGNTYTVTNSFSSSARPAAHPKIKSDTGGSKVVFNLSSGATCSLAYMDATDVDSSGGRRIFSFNGTLSNTSNWQEWHDLTTTTKTFIR